MIDASLLQDHHRSLAQLLATNQDLYDFETNALTRTSAVQHRIDTGDALPAKSRPYRVSPSEHRVISEHVNDMLQKRNYRAIVKPLIFCSCYR